ncbi:MAG TPA: hypothetical protein VHB54_21105 [Mucilaginibacter sp.]|nr:hypothetical protein [Mucilaginibacter sp.]
MHTSNYWIRHFKANALEKRVDWTTKPQISPGELKCLLTSLQAWQLGETSEGAHLIAASEKYADKIGDPNYVDAVKLFIKEEQKHGNNLGLYLDAIGKPRVKQDWGDTLFRKVRYFNTSMELWTIAVIIVESTAQIFYQSLKEASACNLLKSICDDILIDEAWHIIFQNERLAMIYDGKSNFSKFWRKEAYKYFFYATALLVWLGHRRVFKKGGNTFKSYLMQIRQKYLKTVRKITYPESIQFA